MLTAQEIFDRVASHLLTQGRKALSPVGFCIYRGREFGVKCAVGCLIPDEAYTPEIEGSSVNAALIYPTAYRSRLLLEALVAGGVDVNLNAKLLVDLQSVHDLDVPQSWRKKLAEVAERNCLNPHVLKKPAP